jgi:hypothetical protein
VRTSLIESRSDRKSLASDAGFGKVSGLSVLAGTLVAYGGFAAIVTIVAGIASWADVNTNMSTESWKRLGVGSAIGAGVVLLLTFIFGGYVAGRMARRSGMLHGFGVFVLGLVVGGAVAASARQLGAGHQIVRGWRDLGAPTTWHEWRGPGILGGIVGVAGMLIGGLLGGTLGERWHVKLLERALDPTVGPEAALRARAATGVEEADEAHQDAEVRVIRASAAHATGATGAVTGPAESSGLIPVEERQPG